MDKCTISMAIFNSYVAMLVITGGQVEYHLRHSFFFLFFSKVQRRVLRLQLQQLPEQGTRVPGFFGTGPEESLPQKLLMHGSHGALEDLKSLAAFVYPVVRRERFGARGTHIPYRFPIQWGVKELLRLSQPSNSCGSHSSGDNPAVPNWRVDCTLEEEQTHRDKERMKLMIEWKMKELRMHSTITATLRLCGFDGSFLFFEKGNGFSPSCIAESAWKYQLDLMKSEGLNRNINHKWRFIAGKLSIDQDIFHCRVWWLEGIPTHPRPKWAPLIEPGRKADPFQVWTFTDRTAGLCTSYIITLYIYIYI